MYLVVYSKTVHYQGDSLIDARNRIAELVDEGTVDISETDTDVYLIEGQFLPFVVTEAHTEVNLLKP